MAAFTTQRMRKDDSHILSSPDLPPLSLNRFPPEIRDMILANIAAMPKGPLVDMMITSQQMYDHFGAILYRTLNLDENNVELVVKGLLVGEKSGNQPLQMRDENGNSVDFAIASKDQITAHQRKIKTLTLVRQIDVEDLTAATRLTNVRNGGLLERDKGTDTLVNIQRISLGASLVDMTRIVSRQRPLLVSVARIYEPHASAY
ncbi:hypothetical protein V865_005473 [Kwoniella europaea PYCC6329]|uniref:F-box domain-containing protein n=1 Tax=Kwoniella europaea PYCC6329 TaxID=1423913 RepID=A0AAX4KP39_9TREE